MGHNGRKIRDIDNSKEHRYYTGMKNTFCSKHSFGW
ncbi:hypothetical protein EVA_10671 [gut metagenome]|uniref:Uncharacterized protein n=1 Tax=gut metagenome TaxID=749906 RepID=J9GMY2_9ZZZZ